MGIFGDVVNDALSSVFTGGGTDKKLARLLAEGEHATGTLDGIRISSGGDTTEHHDLTVAVTGPHGPWRASVRQRLLPHGDVVRLGMAVAVVHLDGRIVIDWPATLRTLGHDGPADAPCAPTKWFKEPLPAGIADSRIDRKRLERGRSTEAALLAADPMVVMGMSTQNFHLELAVLDEDDRAVTLKRALVPDYARGLLEVGTRLPVAVDAAKPDRVTVDWATAAMRAAGR